MNKEFWAIMFSVFKEQVKIMGFIFLTLVLGVALLGGLMFVLVSLFEFQSNTSLVLTICFSLWVLFTIALYDHHKRLRRFKR